MAHNSVPYYALTSNAVTTDKIADDAVTGSKLAPSIRDNIENLENAIISGRTVGQGLPLFLRCYNESLNPYRVRLLGASVPLKLLINGHEIVIR